MAGDAAQLMSPKIVRKSVAPRFMTPLNGKIVDQGTDVVFEGIIDGEAAISGRNPVYFSTYS